MRLYAMAYVFLCASLWAATALILTGCVQGSPLTAPGLHDAPVPPAEPTITIPLMACPQPDTWTPDEFKALAKALEPLRDDPWITKETLEWESLRRQAIACNASQR